MSYSVNNNFDIGLVPNNWQATPISSSLNQLYAFDVHVENRFQDNEAIGQNFINENIDLKLRVQRLELMVDALLNRLNTLVA